MILSGLVTNEKGRINFIKPRKVMDSAQKARLIICNVKCTGNIIKLGNTLNIL
jgi:hypothetical protein